MRHFSFLIAICFCFCTSNQEWQGTKEVKDGVVYIHNTGEGLWSNSKKMVLERVLSIGVEEGDENYVIARIDDIAIDKNGSIYVCDFLDNCVRVFDRHGLFLRKIGRKGQGPGDLYGPNKVACSKGNVIVHDVGNRRICVYSYDGNYIRSFKPVFPSFSQAHPKGYNSTTSQMVWDMMADGKSTIVLSAAIKVQPNNINPLTPIHTYSIEGECLSSFGEYNIIGETSIGQQVSPITIAFDKNYKIYACNMEDYQISIYNIDGVLKKVISRKSILFDETVLIKQNYFERLAKRGSLSSPVAFPDGKLLVLIGDFGESFVEKFNNYIESVGRGEKQSLDVKRYYDLFDSEGRFLQSFEIDQIYGNIRWIDHEGFLYASNDRDAFPAVHKYKVSFVDK